MLCPGGGECPDPSYPSYLQRPPSLPSVLAHLQYHGGESVWGSVRLLRRSRRTGHQRHHCTERDGVRRKLTPQLHLAQSENQL